MVLGIIGLPTVGHAAWYVVQSVIIFFVIVLSDRLLAHGVQAKHAIYMAFGAFFIGQLVSLVLAYANITVPGLLFSLIIWIVLSETLLEGDTKEKLIVGVIAFVAFLALDFSPLPNMIIESVNSVIDISL